MFGNELDNLEQRRNNLKAVVIAKILFCRGSNFLTFVDIPPVRQINWPDRLKIVPKAIVESLQKNPVLLVEMLKERKV